MRKKVLSVVLCGSLAAMMLAGCGGSSESTSQTKSSGTPASSNQTSSVAASSAASSSTASVTDYGTGELKVWVADEISEFTKNQIAEFQKANPAYAGYTVTVESVGEGDAASNMLTDVDAGADIYGFAQDQLARLVSAGALTPLQGDQLEFVKSNNDTGSVSAATLSDQVYAYPITSDNGYFLYYDKSVVTDPSSIDAIIKSCEDAGKNFYFEINSGWYQPAFFFGAGCQLTYDVDDSGSFTNCNIDYASDNGVAALKAIIALHKSKAFQNGSSVDKATNLGAIVDGTWDSGAAKKAFGDNYACAKLPTFTCNGEQKQLSGFGGFKLIGVKPQTDANKLAVAQAVAQYLSSGDVQVARYAANGWGPSNTQAQQDASVQSDTALQALNEQLQYAIPQGQYPDDYWSTATSLGDSVIAGDYDNASDDDLKAALQQFQDTCISFAGN